MHSFDSLARSMVRPASAAQRRRSARSGSVIAAVIALCCAIAPLGVMVQAYIITV